MTTTPASAAAPTSEERAVVRAPASSRAFTRWTPDDLEVAEALSNGGTLWQAADLCWALLGDGRVRAALETRVKGLMRLPMSWDEAGDRRSSGRVARALEGGDWYASHSEAALCSLALWGILLGVGIAQRVWLLAPGGRWIAVLKPYDARYLRWDAPRRRWVVRTELGDVDILPGNRRWVLYAPSCSGAPDGDERPWMYGAWRACDAPWLLKALTLGDFGHHLQMHGSAIRTADYDDTFAQNAPSKDVRDDLCDAMADLGADASLVPPPGMKLRLMEAVANTWEMFPEATKMAATEIVVAITGQSSSTEIAAGQDTGATLHGTVRQDLIECDARTLATCLREQCLVDYAALNFGAGELAPWPKWKTEPPADIKARGEAMKALGEGMAALEPWAPEGQRIHRARVFEDASVPLEDAPEALAAKLATFAASAMRVADRLAAEGDPGARDVYLGTAFHYERLARLLPAGSADGAAARVAAVTATARAGAHDQAAGLVAEYALDPAVSDETLAQLHAALAAPA